MNQVAHDKAIINQIAFDAVAEKVMEDKQKESKLGS